MLDLLKADLDSHKVFNGDLPPLLKQIVEAIPNQDIPYRMKLTLAVSEAILMASHLRRNIAHWNGSMIPINSITFSIAESGAGKDSSVTAARKCFAAGYKLIDTKRKQLATAAAIKLTQAEGIPDPEQFESYKHNYRTPNPLFVAPSTAEGFIQHLNDLDTAGTGAGFTFSG